jgi:hypothetical protein
MSATTMAVAVNHGTPVDGPPDAELGMTDSPPAPQHYTVQPKKIQQAFSTILAPPWCDDPATQERPPAVGAGGRKNLDGSKTCSPVSYASATGSS